MTPLGIFEMVVVSSTILMAIITFNKLNLSE